MAHIRKKLGLGAIGLFRPRIELFLCEDLCKLPFPDHRLMPQFQQPAMYVHAQRLRKNAQDHAEDDHEHEMETFLLDIHDVLGDQQPCRQDDGICGGQISP